MFFQWAYRHERAEVAGTSVTERDVLTWEHVEAEFDEHPAPAEYAPPSATP